MKTYELIDHTADIRIRVKADGLKGLFINAAAAIFDIIGQKLTEGAREEKIEIRQKADNIEELFINWLNELLSLSAAKDLIFSDFKINKLNKNNLEAVAVGSDAKAYRLNTEIKAATYHQLKIQETKSGWQVEVIFDV